ncbi:GNAT family N-acetyltransferase [Hellea balneolensis]|uniref:GNAT family N-acetyltransferase n=1 Tax=Hellea balneolensis TaxID=287478 RepID=UPI000413A905|nr:GNAT family N-acetyltransferase [Hellea balneolensis]
MNIRRATQEDYDAVWSLTKPVIREGRTYPLPQDLDKDGALAYWFALDKDVFIAEQGKVPVGVYYIRPNNAGPGNHVCNCGYVTNAEFRGQGIAAQLCEHSLKQARHMGYRAMQYNLVVSTNKPAVHLWTKMGFEIVGRLPMAFQDPVEGDVEAYVMFQKL